MRNRRLARAFSIALVLAGSLALVDAQGRGGARPPQAPPGSRNVVVLSDLHMGIGRDSSGAWDATEDFRWLDAFQAFLRAMDTQGQGRTDLIINGDAFDLLQTGQSDCVHDDPSLGCTAQEALARLNRVLAAHDGEMKALGAFARSGSNRVVFVPGDHDAALLFPLVGDRALSAVGAPAGRVEVARAGEWRSADGQVYVEHGHQIGFSADRFDRWPTPFIERDGRQYLARPWGEQLIQPYYNKHEPTYQILDNVAEEGAGVKFALAAQGAVDAGTSVAKLLEYFMFKLTWQQFRVQLVGGEVQPAVWNLAQVRAGGAAAVLAGLPDDDRFKPFANKALAEGALAAWMKELDDEELSALCDYRAAVRRMRRRVERTVTQFPPTGPAVSECPRSPETRGPMFEYFWRPRDTAVTSHIESAERRSSSAAQKPIAAMVRAHTHLVDRESTGGFVPSRTARTPVVIDDGAFQRIVTPAQLDVVKKERQMTDDQLLKIKVEQLAPCYSFVHIPPYADAPKPVRRYWRTADKGGWELAPLEQDEDRAVQLLEQLSPCTREPVTF